MSEQQKPVRVPAFGSGTFPMHVQGSRHRQGTVWLWQANAATLRSKTVRPHPPFPPSLTLPAVAEVRVSCWDAPGRRTARAPGCSRRRQRRRGQQQPCDGERCSHVRLLSAVTATNGPDRPAAHFPRAHSSEPAASLAAYWSRSLTLRVGSITHCRLCTCCFCRRRRVARPGARPSQRLPRRWRASLSALTLWP